MIRDITIGQYYPTYSIIHQLDPRVKINGTFAFILSIFFVGNFYGYIVAALFLFGTIRISKVPVKFILKGLKAIFMILLFTVLLNMFLTPGENVLLKAGPLTVTDKGFELAIFMAIRLIFLIMGSSLLTLTTSPIQLTDGIERLLSPLTKIKVPAHEIAMMMTIALRFIPILLEETDKIMKAQMARGADFDSGNIIKKAKSLIPLLVPLFISAFRRADDLAMAMEARCYRGGEGRTKLKELIYERKDFIAYCILLAYFVMIIIV
ncbi:energy-coupling factor transport system permease protein [Natranaerovirga pectinivora]|uniref:Energy-coupling factor transporter transmembrane protein EcfT n=1 Tax=Natranaerovirga pectinivora TaxID=682400 RepID=A0A4R3MPI5_9FIRM|nr:energy-coupling factor transporter transmembrane component T [Natranaerovirga pectinivora]TCT14098.1 energy-coupling factor transport system permease protein [Natranaerovirga pectinivora]